MKLKEYISRCLKDRSDLDGYVSDRDILFSAVDFLDQTENIYEVTQCMADISSCCARLLLFGSRKITELGRRKDGGMNG